MRREFWDGLQMRAVQRVVRIVWRVGRVMQTQSFGAINESGDGMIEGRFVWLLTRCLRFHHLLSSMQALARALCVRVVCVWHVLYVCCTRCVRVARGGCALMRVVHVYACGTRRMRCVRSYARGVRGMRAGVRMRGGVGMCWYEGWCVL